MSHIFTPSLSIRMEHRASRQDEVGTKVPKCGNHLPIDAQEPVAGKCFPLATYPIAAVLVVSARRFHYSVGLKGVAMSSFYFVFSINSRNGRLKDIIC